MTLDSAAKKEVSSYVTSPSPNSQKLNAWDDTYSKNPTLGSMRSRTQDTSNQSLTSPNPRRIYRGVSIDDLSQKKLSSNPTLELSHYKCYAETYLFVDYFNNMLKCWEPLIEPVAVILMHEQVIAIYYHIGEIMLILFAL